MTPLPSARASAHFTSDLLCGVRTCSAMLTFIIARSVSLGRQRSYTFSPNIGSSPCQHPTGKKTSARASRPACSSGT
ncbi:hypothetical protein L227DRAFT_220927 [Lentinus tigrinus ALCF2SS1-6]|uniref:Uncharacterized protein n=1 Tax=Lentinus tigrinus ALCF2SS1-6 TaxID=1328759 RepID=A0A5C2S2L1_9APHY|nr:hypothetical protein L227DRAFT_220927 [Lentinus tigrinus ALCF2SS1-6]